MLFLSRTGNYEKEYKEINKKFLTFVKNVTVVEFIKFSSWLKSDIIFLK